MRDHEQVIKDEEILNSLSDLLVNVNDKVKEISYVSSATKELNDELKNYRITMKKFLLCSTLEQSASTNSLRS